MSQAQLVLAEHFSPSIKLHNGRPATTSLEVAKFFGKRHDAVIRDIRNLIVNSPESFHTHNFVEMFEAVEIGNGATRQSIVFIIFRDGFMLLAMGYTGKKALQIKLAYIEAFNQIEAQLAANKVESSTSLPQSAELLPPSHQAQLKAIVDAKVGMLPSDAQRKAYVEIWSRFSRHFQIARYQQLPSERVGEAITYLVEMQIKERKPLPQGKESKALPTSGAMPIEFEPPCPVPVEDDISQAFKRARAVTEYLKALKLQIHVPCRVQAASLSFLNNRKEIELYKALDKQIDYSLCSLDSATCALESAWHLSKFMQEERKSARS